MESKFKIVLFLSVAVVWTLFLCRCGKQQASAPTPSGGDTTIVIITPPPPGPSRLQDVQKIFTGSCAVVGCHNGANPAFPPPGGLDLRDGMTYWLTVNIPSFERPDLFRITPGDTLFSYLLKKLRGDADIVGLQMPRGACGNGPCAPLPRQLISMINSWVISGAPRN